MDFVPSGCEKARVGEGWEAVKLYVQACVT